MKRNKFLEDLGLENYGLRFTDKKDKRAKKWKKQRRKYGFDERETWQLNDTFVEWLYSRLMMFEKKAGKMIDFNYNKVTYNGKEYTLGEAISFIAEKCSRYLKSDAAKYGSEGIRAAEEMQEALHLWAEIFPYMWW